MEDEFIPCKRTLINGLFDIVSQNSNEDGRKHTHTHTHWHITSVNIGKLERK